MSSLDRSPWRNTLIYASDNRHTVLGGLYAAEGTTSANLYSMVEIFCLFTDTFELHDDRGLLVERDGQQLQPGNYYIVTNGSITVTEEVPLLRMTWLKLGGYAKSFIDAVRERDGGCAITGRRGERASFGSWESFQVTHIFPLSQEGLWNDFGYGHWITIPPAKDSDGSINSVQNGILIGREISEAFDAYDVTINPDDDYKIVCFSPATNIFGIAGRHLDQTFVNNPLRPVDELLRWHFRQAVLANVKHAGSPCSESDWPLEFSRDFMDEGEIMSDPETGERMGFEQFACCNATEEGF